MDTTTNIRFRDAAQKASTHFIKLMRDTGHQVDFLHQNLIVKKKNDRVEVETMVHIYPTSKRFSRELEGITVRICRRSRAVTYTRKTDDYLSFPWLKIIETIDTDLDYRLAIETKEAQNRTERQQNADLAQKEVPLPVDASSDSIFLNQPRLEGYRHTRAKNGTYRIDFDLDGLTQEEAIAIRDIALARLKRSANTNEAKT